MRLNRFSIATWLSLVIIMAFAWVAQPATAGDLILSNNRGDTSTTWFIDGEPTLVINGFDLNALNVTFPVGIDAVSFGVSEAIPSAPIELVIYGDGNGGSPVDAALLYRQTIQISQTGTVRIPLAELVVTEAPVIWVGFYLPVGFEFLADESGASVLTYWGWTPGTTFDLNNLGAAQVFGPSDGTAPVNLNIGGVARITPELVTQTQDVNVLSGTGETTTGVPVGRQIPGGEAPLSLLQNYPYCGELLFYDPEDIRITARSRFAMSCRADLGPFSPGVIRNAGELPRDIPGYERRGFFYEVFAGGDFKADPSNSEKLVVPVTHCIRPEQADIDTAVVGIAYGAPREWEILPTQRYGELACAEVTHQGFISYFVPRTGDEPNINADLYFSGIPFFEYASGERPTFMFCGFRYGWSYSVRNEGFEATPQTVVRIQMVNERTGTPTKVVDYTVPPILPGETVTFQQPNFIAPTTFFNELHAINLIIDPSNSIPELDEANNVYDFPSILVRKGGSNC